jgi:Rrf2 family transcriptional repressor of oqxAB
MAVHALAVLSTADDWLRSDSVAASLNAQPSHVRALLATLVQAGLVESREGRSGGYRLARAPEKIALANVYDAIESDGLLAPSPTEPSKHCHIGGGIRKAFDEIACTARQAVLDALADESVADVARRAYDLGGRRAPTPGFHAP